MTEKDTLEAELRAVREVLARREVHEQHPPFRGSLLSPPVDTAFVRLTQLSTEQLEQHEQRLQQDLEDLERGFAAALEASEAGGAGPRTDATDG